MPALVSVRRVEARLRQSLAGAELVLAQTLIDEVSALARVAVPDIDDLVEASTDHATIVAGRLAYVVWRVMSNPEGRTQVQIDDYSYRYSAETVGGVLYLDDQDVAVLSGGSATGVAYSSGPYVVGLGG